MNQTPEKQANVLVVLPQLDVIGVRKHGGAGDQDAA